jgi:hypothetical protein
VLAVLCLQQACILIPGYWMLFVMDEAGVPSVSKIMMIGLDKKRIIQPIIIIFETLGTPASSITNNIQYPGMRIHESFGRVASNLHRIR